MWKKEIMVARDAALKAGEAIIKVFKKGFKVQKKGTIDLVTDADLWAEQEILNTIRAEFPQDSILSEERGEKHGLSPRTWIIDPLDGTTNFAHGLQFVSVSIALKEGKDYVLGVVYNPFLDELFEARYGLGALLNNRPIGVSKVERIGDALLVTGFPYYVKEKPGRVIRAFEGFLMAGQGVRRLGSAAIDLCYVAMGRFDGFWEEGLKPWDTAAGALILKEAGGMITDFSGAPYDPFNDTLLSSNGILHEQMLRVISKALPTR